MIQSLHSFFAVMMHSLKPFLPTSTIEPISPLPPTWRLGEMNHQRTVRGRGGARPPQPLEQQVCPVLTPQSLLGPPFGTTHLTRSNYKFIIYIREMRSSLFFADEIQPSADEIQPRMRMRSILLVRASDCQCTSCNGPGFDPSIRRHSGI